MLRQLVRQAVDAFALQFSEAEKRFAEISLVRSPPLTPGTKTFVRPDDGNGIHADTSLFNPRWLQEFGMVPRTIFDIGSYDGGDAIRFAQTFPLASVFTFEADPDRFAIVERNTSGFGIKAINLAVCDHDGETDWFPIKSANGAGGQGSIFAHTIAFAARYPAIKQADTMPVPCTRLDTFCSRADIRRIDLMHIDVEGAEFNVIEGLGALRPRMIFLETMSRDLWQGAKSSADVHRLLSRRGYVLAGDFRSDRLYVAHDSIGEKSADQP